MNHAEVIEQIEAQSSKERERDRPFDESPQSPADEESADETRAETDQPGRSVIDQALRRIGHRCVIACLQQSHTGR